MAIRIELPKELLKAALEQRMQTLQRQANQATNPIIKDALEKEKAVFYTAVNGITETK